MDRRTDQQTYLAFEMQFYISVMFLGPPDDVQEEKPFLQFKKKCITDRPTDGRTDGQTLCFVPFAFYLLVVASPARWRRFSVVSVTIA